MPAAATMDRPGSAEIRTDGSTPVRAHAAAGGVGPLGLGRGRLAVDVGHAEAAAHDELGQTERGEEPAQHLRRLFERRHVEDLAPDVGVHADQLDRGQQLEGGHRLGRRARRHREAELGVLSAGADELVGVGLDAGRDPDQDGRAARRGAEGESSRRPSRAISSKESTTMRPTPHSRAVGQLLFRLVVAVEDQLVGRHAGGEGDVELTPRRHIEVHALLMGQAGHGATEERLGGVGHPVPPGLRRRPGRRDAGGTRRRRRAACRTRRPGRAGRYPPPADARPRPRPPSGAAVPARRGRWRPSSSVGMVKQDTAGSTGPGTGPRPGRLRSSPALAPVAQRIEHRPPEPVAQVRVLPGALCVLAGQEAFLVRLIVIH